MAQTKTYKGKKNEYYAGQVGYHPRDEGMADTYYIGPVNSPGETHGMQNQPRDTVNPDNYTQFGEQNGKQKADDNNSGR